MRYLKIVALIITGIAFTAYPFWLLGMMLFINDYSTLLITLSFCGFPFYLAGIITALPYIEKKISEGR